MYLKLTTKINLTYLKMSSALHKKDIVKQADLVHTPQNVAYDQGLHCLHKIYSNLCKILI